MNLIHNQVSSFLTTKNVGISCIHFSWDFVGCLFSGFLPFGTNQQKNRSWEKKILLF